MLFLHEHIEETQFGTDNHNSNLLRLIVSVFLKVRLHHIAKNGSTQVPEWQHKKKKYAKRFSFRGFNFFFFFRGLRVERIKITS